LQVICRIVKFKTIASLLDASGTSRLHDNAVTKRRQTIASATFAVSHDSCGLPNVIRFCTVRNPGFVCSRRHHFDILAMHFFAHYAAPFRLSDQLPLCFDAPERKRNNTPAFPFQRDLNQSASLRQPNSIRLRRTTLASQRIALQRNGAKHDICQVSAKQL
jgi:hypothetical protein